MNMKAMTKDSIESQRAKLIAQHNDLDLLVQRIDSELAQAIAEGDTNVNVTLLRERRRSAIEEANDISEALHLLEDQADTAQAKEQKASRAAARKEAKKAATQLVKTAGELDRALTEVERCHEALRLGAYDLNVSLRRAGHGTSNRMSNMLGSTLRWASWQSAPGYSEAAEIPRAPNSRRRTMVDGIATLIPQLPPMES